MAVLLCPLCSQPRFNNLESLRVSLINAATQSISCPICSEVLMGLDKLTIHLFGHTINQNPEKAQCLELKISKPDNTTQDFSTTFFQNEPAVADDLIPRTESDKNPIGGYTEEIAEEDKKKNDQSTVNMEDLSFLTSWDNPSRTEFSNSDNKSSEIRLDKDDERTVTNSNEESTQLSDYMSDLLKEKLPVLNFVFAMDTTEKNKAVQESTDSEQSKCSTCDYAFQNSIILSMHKELVHSNSNTKSVRDHKGEDELKNPQVEDMFKNLMLPNYNCHLCSKSFKMKGSLLVHYRVAHLGVGNSESSTGENQDFVEERNFRCSICNKSFKKEQHLTQHIKTHEGKQWQCETCNKHFTTKYFLKKHQRLHTGEMPYSCQTCNKTFTFQQSYHKHLLYHSDEKPHQCTQCGRSFKELSTLHNHQRIHSGEKPFACETCGKCFRQRVSYIVHQRIHTGVLPYQCTACKKKFRYKVSQRSHKCTVEPPGIVVRQPGNLIQKILEQRSAE